MDISILERVERTKNVEWSVTRLIEPERKHRSFLGVKDGSRQGRLERRP
jgi:hypothetical protein